MSLRTCHARGRPRGVTWGIFHFFAFVSFADFSVPLGLGHHLLKSPFFLEVVGMVWAKQFRMSRGNRWGDSCHYGHVTPGEGREGEHGVSFDYLHLNVSLISQLLWGCDTVYCNPGIFGRCRIKVGKTFSQESRQSLG